MLILERRKMSCVVYECLRCENSEKIRGGKEELPEVIVCRKCNGASVDSFRKYKYKVGKPKRKSLKVDLDVSGAVEGMKVLQCEIDKATAALEHFKDVFEEMDANGSAEWVDRLLTLAKVGVSDEQ